LARAGSTKSARKATFGERIGILQGTVWNRGDQPGPSSVTMKVRIDPKNELLFVSRKAVRLAPRPYVAATVNEIGTGNLQGYYLVAWGKYPNIPKHTEADSL
jgi:hypothetical protein